MSGWSLVTMWLGCAGSEPLLAALDGEWSLTLAVDGASVRDGSAAFTWQPEDEQLEGTVLIDDGEEEREFDLSSAFDVAELGMALTFLENAGVRQLFMDLPPATQGSTNGPWSSIWGCAEEPTGLCRESGDVGFQR